MASGFSCCPCLSLSNGTNVYSSFGLKLEVILMVHSVLNLVGYPNTIIKALRAAMSCFVGLLQ